MQVYTDDITTSTLAGETQIITMIKLRCTFVDLPEAGRKLLSKHQAQQSALTDPAEAERAH